MEDINKEKIFLTTFDEQHIKGILGDLFTGRETYLTGNKIDKAVLNSISENEKIFMENIRKQIKQE